MKRIGLAAFLTSVAMGCFAHAPFVAPSSYVVHGGNTAVLAGFAEAPFDAEVAIKGFDLKATLPNGEQQKLELHSSKALSTANVKTAQTGTYAITGLRTGELKYANIGQRWLRVLDAKAEGLAPLTQRSFVTPSEVSAQNQQVSVQRFDRLLSYFSKEKMSELPQEQNQQWLNLKFSAHPNQISLKTPFTVQLNLGQRAASGFQVLLEKQITQVNEAETAIKLQTNHLGEVTLPFAATGQYLVTITSPELAETVKPVAQTYRTILSLYVSP